MKRSLGVVAAFLCLLGSSVAVLAAPMELKAVAFPDRKTLAVELLPGTDLAGAKVTAVVSYREGQATIQISYGAMKPALLFGGSVTTHVVWAVTPEGVAENLGELRVLGPKGSQQFVTEKRSFALVVTAESYRLVRRPSSLVLLASGSPSSDYPVVRFSFDGFGPAPVREVADLSGVPFDGKLAVEWLQAARTHVFARELGAPTHATELYQEAEAILTEANALAARSPRSKTVAESARRALALDNEAIQLSLRRQEALDLERRIAAQRAEMESLQEQVAGAEAQAVQARRDVELLQADALALRHEKDNLESEMVGMRSELFTMEESLQKLHQEKQALGERLESALSHVAEVRQSVRGFVVSLPDILFGVDDAALTAEAQVVIAKLTGILLVMPDLQVVIEGHTDGRGSAEYNLKLSYRRAERVKEFMVAQGVSEGRLRAFGFGLERPVTDNDSAEGRRKNRRVEIVILEGPNPTP